MGLKHSTLRIRLSPNIGPVKWENSLSEDEYKVAIEKVCALAPEPAEAIRALPPQSCIGHLLLFRTGAVCPEIVISNMNYLVRESLKRRLEERWLYCSP